MLKVINKILTNKIVFYKFKGMYFYRLKLAYQMFRCYSCFFVGIKPCKKGNKIDGESYYGVVEWNTTIPSIKSNLKIGNDIQDIIVDLHNSIYPKVKIIALNDLNKSIIKGKQNGKL